MSVSVTLKRFGVLRDAILRWDVRERFRVPTELRGDRYCAFIIRAHRQDDIGFTSYRVFARSSPYKPHITVDARCTFTSEAHLPKRDRDRLRAAYRGIEQFCEFPHFLESLTTALERAGLPLAERVGDRRRLPGTPPRSPYFSCGRWRHRDTTTGPSHSYGCVERDLAQGRSLDSLGTLEHYTPEFVDRLVQAWPSCPALDGILLRYVAR